MPFPVLGSNSAVAGYEIDNSLRFNDDDSPEISFTLNQTPTHQDKGTWSFWIKRANIQSAVVRLYSGYADGGATQTWIRFDANDCLDVANRVSASFNTRLITNRKFRDPSAWLHIVISFDTTDGTSSNRAKIYINGVQETSFSTETYPSQNDDLEGNTNGIQQSWGCDGVNNLEYFDGYFSDVYFIDGQQLAPTEFGETNDNGVWIPKRFSGSFGNNGYKLEFKNSGSLGTDTSGNGNNFTATNLTATDQTTDTPTNNFATGNPLAKYINDTNVTYSEGNVKGVAEAVATSYNFLSTFGVGKGKWFWEVKATDVNQNNDTRIGVIPEPSIVTIDIGGVHNQVVYRGDGSVTSSGETSLTSQGNITDGMIVGVALDMDNFTVDWYLDGTLTSTISINSTYRDTNYFAYFRHVNSGTAEFNFGNPSFSISSGNSDANGYGNFEYAVPSGYYSLCSKNLAEFG